MVMVWFRAFLRTALGYDQLPWAQDAWRAFDTEADLDVFEVNPEDYDLDPNTNPVAKCLSTNGISIVYLRNSNGREIRESMDIHVHTSEKRGGMIVRITNGELVSWNRPTTRKHFPILNRERYWYEKLLNGVREQVGVG
jgi:hypothetical protein